MTNPQAAVNEAYRMAIECNHACYVYGAHDLTPPYTVTTNQPSRFRPHWRIDPTGELSEYVPPHGPASRVPETIKYRKVD